MPNQKTAIVTGAWEGIGGLGHLAVQSANKFGHKVAMIGRGPDHAALAKKLGAAIWSLGEALTTRKSVISKYEKKTP